MNKKVILFLTLLICIFLTPQKIKASTKFMYPEDILSESDDFKEIRILESEIIQKAKSTCRICDDAYVDYDNAVRVYNSFLLFERDEVSEKRINEIVDACNERWFYAWQIPVYSAESGRTVGVVVARQQPLSENGKDYCTEEDQKMINETVGQYKITDADNLLALDRDTIMSYVKGMEGQLPAGTKVRIFGSQPGFVQPVAAVIADSGLTGMFSVGYNYDIEYYNSGSFVTYKYYDYKKLYKVIEQLKEIVRENAEQGKSGMRGTNMLAPAKKSLPIVCLIVVVVAGMCLVILTEIMIKKRRRD